MDFYKKIKIFCIKESRKKLSLLFIVVKAVLSLFIISLLPVIFFIIFIFKEPREIQPINDYIITKVQEQGIGATYSSAKITINRRFRVIYKIENLRLKFENGLNLTLPSVVFRIKISDILRKRVFFDDIVIDSLTSSFGYEEDILETDTENSTIFSYNDIKKTLYNIIDNLHNKIFIFDDLYINNSIFYFYNNKTKSLDKLNIFNSDIKIVKNNDFTNITFSILSSMNSDEKITSKNICTIKDDKKINCKSTLYNLYTSSLFNILNKDIVKYSENVEGLFDFEILAYFEDYINLKDTGFKIYSKAGSFYLKDFFSKKINYKDLEVDGDILEENNIVLNKVIAKLNDDGVNNMDFNLYLNFKNKERMDLNIYIANTNFNKMDTFWPIFLDDLGIRDWVIQHFKYGNISDAFVKMEFKHDKKDGFSLDRLQSEVNFSNTFLDYDSAFPAAKNLSGKAIFTQDDVLININKGEIETTKINNGKVYINFITPISSVNIAANTIGSPVEMLYFIDYEEKNKINEMASNFINGTAKSVINVDIPLIDDLNLDKVYIKIDSDLNGVNSSLFKNNSSLKLGLFKDYNSNNFRLNLNLDNTEILCNEINFLKNKSNRLRASTDIIIENDFVFLKNINVKDKALSLNGNAVLTNGDVSLLELYNIKYLDNNFNIKYANNVINIYGDKISLNFDKKKGSNNIKNIDYTLDFKFNKILLNNEYELRLVDLLYSDNILKISSSDVDISIKEDGNKYFIMGEIEDIGNFMNNAKINKNIMGGNLYFDGEYSNDVLNMNLRIKDGFSFITSTVKNTNFFRYLLNNDLLSKNLREKLENENSFSFERANAEILLYDKTLKLKSFALESKSVFGIGIAGKGKMSINTGKIDLNGVIIPADKLNTLFGLNKIPLINNLLFGGKNGGLFTIGYEFTKENYASDYNFKLVPVSASGINSLKNAFLLLLLL